MAVAIAVPVGMAIPVAVSVAVGANSTQHGRGGLAWAVLLDGNRSSGLAGATSRPQRTTPPRGRFCRRCGWDMAGADEDILQRLVKKTLYIGFFAFIKPIETVLYE